MGNDIQPGAERARLRLSSFSNRSASSNGPISARRSASSAIRSCATRCTSSTVTALSAGEHLVGLGRAPLEHLAAQAEQDQPLRALELEHEPALREVLRLLELVRRHRLGRDLAELAEDRRHRLVDAVDVDARLRVQRARVGVAVVHPEDVVREPAPLAHLGEEARRHAAAEHGREHLERVAVGMLERIARHAEDRRAPGRTAS